MSVWYKRGIALVAGLLGLATVITLDNSVFKLAFLQAMIYEFTETEKPSLFGKFSETC
jgi:hypothetical protein